MLQVGLHLLQHGGAHEQLVLLLVSHSAAQEVAASVLQAATDSSNGGKQ
jgi:hypothetical protein